MESRADGPMRMEIRSSLDPWWSKRSLLCTGFLSSSIQKNKPASLGGSMPLKLRLIASIFARCKEFRTSLGSLGFATVMLTI